MKGEIQHIYRNSRGNVTGVEILGDNDKHYYSHVGDFKEVEGEIYKIRDEIQNNIKEGSKVSFKPFINKMDGRATSVNILN